MVTRSSGPGLCDSPVVQELLSLEQKVITLLQEPVTTLRLRVREGQAWAWRAQEGSCSGTGIQVSTVPMQVTRFRAKLSFCPVMCSVMFPKGLNRESLRGLPVAL